jgi:hypothetical protein
LIGYAKPEHRMGRNYLAGTHGDDANAILAAARYNFRRLLDGWLSYCPQSWPRSTPRPIMIACSNPPENVLQGRLTMSGLASPRHDRSDRKWTWHRTILAPSSDYRRVAIWRACSRARPRIASSAFLKAREGQIAARSGIPDLGLRAVFADGQK